MPIRGPHSLSNTGWRDVYGPADYTPVDSSPSFSRVEGCQPSAQNQNTQRMALINTILPTVQNPYSSSFDRHQALRYIRAIGVHLNDPGNFRTPTAQSGGSDFPAFHIRRGDSIRCNVPALPQWANPPPRSPTWRMRCLYGIEIRAGVSSRMPPSRGSMLSSSRAHWAPPPQRCRAWGKFAYGYSRHARAFEPNIPIGANDPSATTCTPLGRVSLNLKRSTEHLFLHFFLSLF